MFDLAYDVGRDYWNEFAYFAVIGFMILWTAFAFIMVFWRDHATSFLGFSTPQPSWWRDLLFGVHRVLSSVFLTIGIAVTVWLISMFWGGYSELRSAVGEGRCRQIEGVVQNFAAEDSERGTPESFEVSGVAFSYEGGVANGGFHRVRAGGGPIAPGSQVRLCYVQRFGSNLIVRLEVARTG